ncbi:aldo/keto reductase [Algoriphagus sp. CAU 1675]|uniref:aldo/keto reductase n=1 Tax=Algoriphagus sp. CAU 1675 TaxID=3032597 RepID=UPI0023DBCC91|nr:aldo/keto reductase [Algoriphagus sp. CAU 1675]MDF2158143.1 aldo/keto reductase [Algoriphagus sp. CAU 1675]
MEKVKLPLANFEVSQIALGCMSLSGDKRSDLNIIDAAIAGGITMLDTADLYQNGLNEESVGFAIQSRRKDLILATKVGNQIREDGSGWDWNPSKKYILEAVEKSLKRLQTDYIDLYQLHGGTLDDPWEETLEAFELLKTQGKIRAFGISSIRPNVIRKVMEMNPPVTFMMQYNPLDRRPEETVFPVLEQSKTRVLVRGALAKGMLINKPERPYLNYNAEKVVSFRKEIQSHGYSPEAVLIRFGLDQKAVASLVIGASSVQQIEQIFIAWEEGFSISPEFISQLRRKLPANNYHEHR